MIGVKDPKNLESEAIKEILKSWSLGGVIYWYEGMSSYGTGGIGRIGRRMESKHLLGILDTFCFQL